MSSLVAERVGSVFRVSQDNARVSLLVRRERWCDADGYEDCDAFDSSVRLTEFYAQHDPSRPRAPKGLPRRMLCLALQVLLDEGDLERDSVMVLEADASDDDLLVKKVYRPMGFATMSTEQYGTTLMMADVRGVLKWCHAHTNGL